jgi:hypothetical protein
MLPLYPMFQVECERMNRAIRHCRRWTFVARSVDNDGAGPPTFDQATS